MKNNLVKSTAIILTVLTILLSFSGCKKDAENTETVVSADTVHIEREEWATDVKTAINDFLDANGKNSEGYDENSYAVFDFDNTCSIFDMEDTVAVYQLEHMAFAITPDKMNDILHTEISSPDRNLAEWDFPGVTYNKFIHDITKAYSALWDSYGPFTANGIEDNAELIKDPMWLEFAAKIRTLYDLICDVDTASVGYPWVLYLFSGMTEDEVYQLATKALSEYKEIESCERTWKSPEDIQSEVGAVTYTYLCGVSVTENIVELWKALSENGIDVWVCSASCTAVIKGAIDVFGLHDFCTGMLAMTNKKENNIYINAYDYETGCGYLAKENNKWEQDILPTCTQTQEHGKITAINNVLVKKYGHGPIAGFMDSAGDYNFCTEYETLKLVVCFNRANRKLTDGAGVIAPLAIYQRDTLGYNYEKAAENGDTLYVLQGREENGMRKLRSSNKTVRLNETEEKLFANEDNEALLKYMIDNKLTTKDVINTFCIKTEADAENNPLGVAYGFMTEYDGYHSQK